MPEEIAKGKLIGEITHFFGKIGVGVVKLSDSLNVGDQIVISGHGHEFEQTVDSMQVEHKQVQSAKKGDEVGMKVTDAAKEGCKVFLRG